jgi:hypothetical protein
VSAALSTGASAPSPHRVVQAAWERARDAGVYQFSTDLVQTTRPLPVVTNIGREAKREFLHLEGTLDQPARTFEMTLWSQGGSVLDASSGVSVRVDGERAFARSGNMAWQEINDFTGLFAPEGDLLAFLAAAKNIQKQNAGQSTPMPGYTFEIDGYAFAAYVRDRMEARLAETGELPPGMELALPETYRAMTGRGELWLTADGYPLRLHVLLELPPQENASIVAEITTDFAGFAASAGLSSRSPSAAPSFFNWLSSLQALLWVFPLGIIIAYTPRRTLQSALAIVLCLSFVLTPLLQSAQAATFSERQAAKSAEMEARQQESEIARTVREVQEAEQPRIDGRAALEMLAADTGLDTDRDGLTDVQELVLGTSPQLRDSTGLGISDKEAVAALGDVHPLSLLSETGTDSDGDGLTDYEESMLGTDPYADDTDVDGVSDYDEVMGFEYNEEHYYTDPLEADSNQDGMPDGLEWKWPGTFHDTWDLDGDGVPDLFDRDNDGDGVPDKLDLSPFSAPDKTFTRDDPLTLQVSDLNPGYVAYVELQFRPTITAQLRYAYNVLDWPYDTAGQMQDLDGATFYDVNPDLPMSPNANGDVKLVPMLEIRTAGTTSNLPLRATPPETTLTLQDITVSGIGSNVTLGYSGADTVLEYANLQPASGLVHRIYSGDCGNLGAVAYTLSPDGNGRAVLSGVHINTVTGGNHALVASHASDLAQGYACANLPRLAREGAKWIDTELLDHYGISILPQANGEMLLYVPAQLTTVEQTGEHVAFYAKMVYRPEAAWSGAHSVRLVWLVQALVDHCRNGNPADCTILNNPEVLHTYYS